VYQHKRAQAATCCLRSWCRVSLPLTHVRLPRCHPPSPSTHRSQFSSRMSPRRPAIMSFATNTILCCQICDTVYATANHAFALNCADEGCKAHTCFDCMQKAVFSGSGNQDKLCPHCRRPVHSYSYAFFSVCQDMKALREQLAAADAEATHLKSRLAMSKLKADRAAQRLDDWRTWATASKNALLAMPSAATLPHVVSPRPRSRSPPVRYVEYNG